MGLIMRDSVPYAGSNDIVLTQAQYDALVQAGEVLPNVNYYISNANHSTPIYASGVHYDNSNSGLDADDVQEAIDEVAPVKTSIGNIDNVTLTTPAVGDTLTWNGSAWVNNSTNLQWVSFTNVQIATDLSRTGVIKLSAVSANTLSESYEYLMALNQSTGQMYMTYIRKDNGNLCAGEAMPAGNQYQISGVIHLA